MKSVYPVLAILLAFSMGSGQGFAQKPGTVTAGGIRSKVASPKAAAKPSEPAKDAGKAAAKEKEKAPVERKPVDLSKLAASGPNVSYVEVSSFPGGKPMLLIHYPWKQYSRPSVEVRILADDERDTGELRPLGFVSQIMKGDVTLAVYQCLDLATENPVVKKFTKQGLDFEVIGLKNHLGRPAGQVVFPPKPHTDDVVARVAYFPLEPWGADAETLRLELPADHFSKPYRVRVWFYRDASVVWWQTVAWPGMTKSQ